MNIKVQYMKMEKVKKAYASSSNDIFSPALIIKFHQSISRTKRKRMFQWQFSNAYFPLERVFFFMFGFMFPISKFIFQLTRSLNDFSQFLSCQEVLEIHLSPSTASFSLCATILIYFPAQPCAWTIFRSRRKKLKLIETAHLVAFPRLRLSLTN